MEPFAAIWINLEIYHTLSEAEKTNITQVSPTWNLKRYVNELILQKQNETNTVIKRKAIIHCLKAPDLIDMKKYLKIFLSEKARGNGYSMLPFMNLQKDIF